MIKMIAAVSLNGIIGIDGGIPWQDHFRDDMRFFSKMTKNSIVIMGRKTWESMNDLSLGRERSPLPGRESRIVANKDYVSGGWLVKGELPVINLEPRTNGEKVIEFHQSSEKIYHSLKDAIDAPNLQNKDIWLIGGEHIYNEGLEYADEIYITRIPENIDITNKTSIAYFPDINLSKWNCKRHTIADFISKVSQNLTLDIYKLSNQ